MARPARDRFAEVARLPCGPGHPEPGWAPQEGGEACTRTGRQFVFICKDCKTLHVAPQPCMRLDCQACAGRVKSRRGARLFGAMGGQPVLHWVLTVHGSWWHALSPERVAALRPMVARLVMDWFKARRGFDVGVVVNIHPTGSTCERCRHKHEGGELERTGQCSQCGAPAPWRPHFDCIIPAAAVKGDIALSFPAYLPPEELLSFRDSWQAFANRLADALGLPRQRAGVWHGFQRGAAKVAHALSYSSRPFPAFYQAMPRSARSPARYGLLAPGAMRASGSTLRARQLYRALVRGRVDKPVMKCERCGGELDFWGSIDPSRLSWQKTLRHADVVELTPRSTGPPRFRGSRATADQRVPWTEP